AFAEGPEDVAIFVVADPNQSIHGFAGGGMVWAQELVGTQAITYRLVDNFRCAAAIRELASRLAIGIAQAPPDTNSLPDVPPGEVLVKSGKDEMEEATIVADWIEQKLTHG